MRIRIAALAACLALAVGHLPAQESGRPASPDQLKQMCEQTVCQHDVRIRLRTPEGETFDKTFAVMPGIVQSFGMVILAGQTIHVEATLKNGELADLVAVAEVVHPERTITAQLEQDEKGGMLLTVFNPFDAPLKFKMVMMPLEAERLIPTSSCPAIPKGRVFESWPHPIFQILLTAGHTLNESGRMVCD